MDLIAQLEAQNETYWRVRMRVITTQRKLRITPIAKKRCRQATNLMIANGSIQKLPCRICGDKKSQTHHLDYEDPEAVIFLCDKHHREWHKAHPIH